MEISSFVIAVVALIAFCILFWYSRKYTKRYHRHKEESHECHHVQQETLHHPIDTGYMYPDSDGVRKNVWISPLGKFYVIRTSGAGKQYNKYIHDSYEKAFTDQFVHDYPQHSYIFN